MNEEIQELNNDVPVKNTTNPLEKSSLLDRSEIKPVDKNASYEDILKSFYMLPGTNNNQYLVSKIINKMKDFGSYKKIKKSVSEDPDSIEVDYNEVRKISLTNAMNIISSMSDLLIKKLLLAFLALNGVLYLFKDDNFYLNTNTSNPELNMQNEQLNKCIKILNDNNKVSSDIYKMHLDRLKNSISEDTFNTLTDNYSFSNMMTVKTGNIYKYLNNNLKDGLTSREKLLISNFLSDIRSDYKKINKNNKNLVLNTFNIKESTYSHNIKTALRSLNSLSAQDISEFIN